MRPNFLRLCHHQAWPRGALLATLALGIAARLAQYLGNRSLWLDEAYLALNILNRDFSGLLRPLDHHQVAPPLFLWAVKLAVSLGGDSEMVLRLVPLIGSILALPLFYRLARGVLSPLGAWLATAMLAWSQPLIYYASEVKPYATDALTSVAACALTLPLIERPMANQPPCCRVLLTGVLGALMPWFSYPSVFVLGGLALSMLIPPLLQRRYRWALRLLIPPALWGLSLLVLYGVVLRSGLSDPFLRAFWREFFAPFPPRSLADLYWYLQAWFDFLVFAGGLPFYGLATFAWLAGAITLWRAGRRALALALVLPLPAAATASMLHLYPLYLRVILFAVPPTFLLIACGGEEVHRILSPHSRTLAVIWVALLLLHPFYRSLTVLSTPWTNEEVRPVIQYIREHWQEGDRIYVYHGAAPTFAYYAPRFDLDDPALYQVGRPSNGDFTVLQEDVARLPRGRVWALFAHIYSFNGISEQSFLLSQLDGRGTQLDRLETRNAAAFLYVLR
ncbi:MAG: glycosyltransferase family 39 protein [Anaerolineae bacterium]|nr:glycosyltransferase family 39 protein [Anaerolineae bacterium]MDW8068021.1 glycosyltransferase family 39 protein [Anaerolineae bacterium]